MIQNVIKSNSKEYDELENLSFLVKNYENEFYPMGEYNPNGIEERKVLEAK